MKVYGRWSRSARRATVVGVSLALVGMTAGTAPAIPRHASPAGRAGRAGPPAVSYFFIPTGSANPRSIAVGPDGNLWFTEADGNRIGRVTPKGVITEFRIGKAKMPYTIAAGGDGNMWFTERVGNKIGVVATSGHLIHEYAVPSADAGPYFITAGPDGNVWFTEGNSSEDALDNIGRVTPGGDVTEFPLHACACFPFGITTGPDGNIWATEELGATTKMNGGSYGTVDRVTPDGKTIHRYAPSNTEQTLPGSLAPGPDGNVWFAEIDATRHTVGKVTPAGAITEYPVPATNSSISSVITGPDGRIWLTKSDENSVVVIRPNGAFVQEFGVHPTPLSLTIGPDGNVWFIASEDNEVGRIHTAKSGHAYVLDLAPGFAPAVRTVRMGTLVDWILEAPGDHAVRDATGMGLFSSGPKPPVSFFEQRFIAAGGYRVRDGFSGPRALVDVPVSLPPTATEGQGFPVTWATGPAASGFVYDVQVQRPGSSHWTPWRVAVTVRSGIYVAHETGRFSFRARLRRKAGGASDWSPPRSLMVAA